MYDVLFKGKNSLKDEWESLKGQIQVLEQTHNPSDGDAENHFDMDESNNEGSNMHEDLEHIEEAENHLFESEKFESQNTQQLLDYNLVNSTTLNSKVEEHKGVSPSIRVPKTSRFRRHGGLEPTLKKSLAKLDFFVDSNTGDVPEYFATKIKIIHRGIFEKSNF
ncbi:uncharacterized protein LOC122512735 [Leptopilina heterotoma]|uniref:uncharacterized protein LOC122512735 n=1 Tax=Leptopilina heterotoma TaxID=63436 RepID=UPI001CAA2325|nr:uncharacterized protein LOC122512735 [Leptopilina heterotoma]